MSKVGIFSGTFDPIHIGHIAFALRAIEKAQLDKVVFLPEHEPRHKRKVTDFEHRINMLKITAKSFEFLEVLELPDLYFTVEQTLPELQKHFPNAKISLLLGSDVAKKIPDWPGVARLVGNVSLIIGLRQNDSQEGLQKLLAGIEPSSNIMFIKTRYPEITATQARKKPADQLDPSVAAYIRSHKLYAD
ncbi:nicotinate-nicotinamide nucleotide adenylyltransferase [Candidatus Saccharibacteria bacterium]|nr:nicotinate-nicotinamide nucleotide adenylyltransferase [Candidatus Saccharibacteria bacterium]